MMAGCLVTTSSVGYLTTACGTQLTPSEWRTIHPEGVTCERCKRKRAFRYAMEARARERGKCHESGCAKTGTWQRGRCQKHGDGMSGLACEDHPFSCLSCQEEAEAPLREARKAKLREEAEALLLIEAKQREEADARRRQHLNEFMNQGYSREQAEALIIKRERDEEVERRHRSKEASRDEAKQRYEEGTYGWCPRGAAGNAT